MVFQQIGYAARSKQFLIRPNFCYPFDPKLPSVVLRLNMLYNNPVFNGIHNSRNYRPISKNSELLGYPDNPKKRGTCYAIKKYQCTNTKEKPKNKKKGTTEKGCLTPLGSLLEKKNRSIKEFLIWSFNTLLCSKRQTVFNTPILVTLYL